MTKTLIQAWHAFVEERSICLSPTTLVTDYAQVTKWLNRCPVQDLEDGRQALIWVLGQQPVKSSRRVCMFVRSMYKWASSDDVGLLSRNPVANFKMPKAPQEDHEVTVISKPEIRLILVALKAKSSDKIDWSKYAEFMLQTGMRTGEVRALKWQDIDYENSRILVRSNYTLTHGYKTSTKTNKKRWVPLNAVALRIIESLLKHDDYLFPWNRSTFQKRFRAETQKLRDAGLIQKAYRPYDLRHVAISRWLESGIPVAQCAAWAGNTNEVIWKSYTGVTQKFEMPVL